MLGLLVKLVVLLGVVAGGGYAVVRALLSDDVSVRRIEQAQADLDELAVRRARGELDDDAYDVAVGEILTWAAEHQLPLRDPRRALPA